MERISSLAVRNPLTVVTIGTGNHPLCRMLTPSTDGSDGSELDNRFHTAGKNAATAQAAANRSGQRTPTRSCDSVIQLSEPPHPADRHQLSPRHLGWNLRSRMLHDLINGATWSIGRLESPPTPKSWGTNVAGKDRASSDACESASCRVLLALVVGRGVGPSGNVCCECQRQNVAWVKWHRVVVGGCYCLGENLVRENMGTRWYMEKS